MEGSSSVPVRVISLILVCLMASPNLVPSLTEAGPTGSRQGDQAGAALLTVAIQQDIPNFNPFDLSSNSQWKEMVLTRWCFEGLSGQDPDGNIFPRLGESWTLDLDSLTVNVTIRDNVKFHDNHTVDTADVLFSFKALREYTPFSRTIVDSFDADGDGACSADEIDGTVDADGDGTYEGVRKVSSTEVSLVMGQANGRFFHETLSVPIIPEHIWEDHLAPGGSVDTLWNSDPKATIGTGPLYYDKGVDDEYRVMRAFEDYWGTEMTTPSGHWMYPQEVAGINFTLYSNNDLAVQTMKLGRLDHIPWTLPYQYVPDLVMDPTTDVETFADNGYFTLAYNMKREPMNLVAFRRAVSHCIDRETIVERYMEGYGQEGDSCLPPYWTDWYNSSVKIQPYDLGMAQQVLTNGGFTGVGTALKMPDGRPVPSLVLMVPPVDYDPIRSRTGEMIAKNLRSLGIDVVAMPVDFDSLVAKMDAFDYDMTIAGRSLLRDPIDCVFDVLGPTSPSNYFGFWSDNVPNPLYERLGGVSTLADAYTQDLADRLHALESKARTPFDRDSQIMYTKWAQGIVSQAIPVDVLYYRVNVMAVSKAWTGWIPQYGSLLNVFTLGALTSVSGPPPGEDVNLLLSIPDKVPTGLELPGNVVVYDGSGNPIMGANVTLDGNGLEFDQDSGGTGADGVFRYNVTGTVQGYTTASVDVEYGGDGASLDKVVQVVALDPPAAFLQVRPDDLFLGPGDSTRVVVNVTDRHGTGLAGIDVLLDENVMGWGSVDVVEVTTNATGEATLNYTAPASLPSGRHVQVRLDLFPLPHQSSGAFQVNSVTQYLVLRNEGATGWHLVSVENVTRISCDATNGSTEITIKAVDQNGTAMRDTIGITYSNGACLASPPATVDTDGTGTAKVTLTWATGIDTNATQVYFRSIGSAHSAGAGVTLLYKGSTSRDIYGGLITLKGSGAPVLDPDADDRLTWTVRVYDIDGDPADVPVSFVLGQPTQGSTAAMRAAPWYIWSSLWDYAAINIWTAADGGSLVASGYMLTDMMSDAELATLTGDLYTSWEDLYDLWYGGTVDELESMRAVQVVNGTWEVQVERDGAYLYDGVPSLMVVPRGRAGFFTTPDYSNFWWQIDGQTALRTDFVVERTDTIHSAKYSADRGVLRPFAPDDNATLEMRVYDQGGNPASGLHVDTSFYVYAGYSYFQTTGAPTTDASGQTSVEVTASPRNTRGEPLASAVTQPLYIDPGANYGWNVLTSVGFMAQPVQLYIDLQVSPVTSNIGEVHQMLVTARVLDDAGTNRSGLPVELDLGGVRVVKTTDSSGRASTTFKVPDLPENGTFNTASVTATVVEEGYGAAAATAWFLSHTFGNEAPVISGISIPDSGYETTNVTWDITGRVTDDGVVDSLTASLDGGEPVTLQVTDGSWTFHMEDLSIGGHGVTFTARDEWGFEASRTVTFVVLPPPNDPPVLSDLSIPDTGYETEDTTWSITGMATDDWSVAALTATLDGRSPVDLTLTGGAWEFAMVDLTVGTHTVVFTVVDEWGLSVNRTVTFTILRPPNQAPRIVSLSIPDSGHETQETSWSIVATVTDDGTIAVVMATLDDGDPVELTAAGGEWPFAMEGLSVGVHTVVFHAEDAEGLYDTRTVTFTILPPPNDPPVIGSVSIPDSGHVTEDTSWSVTLSATDDWSIVGVTASLDGADPVDLVLVEGEWVLDLEDLTLGEHTLTLVVRDEWGLTSSRTVTFEVVDLGPPSGTVTLESGRELTNSTTLGLTWEVADGRPVPWVLYSLGPNISDAGDWVPNDGSASLEYEGPDGVVTVYLWFKDYRDRVSDVATATITVDTTPPVIVVTRPASHTFSGKEVTIHFTVTDNIDTSPIYKVRWSYQGPWRELDEPAFTVTMMNGGVGVLEIAAFDHAGNSVLLTWKVEREDEPTSPVGWWVAIALVAVVAVGAGLWMWNRGRSGQ